MTSPSSPAAPCAETEDLVARLRAGDEDAFRALVRAHVGGLLRFARRFVSTDASAEELVQETWRVVLEGIDGFAGRAQLKTWLYGILANLARKRAGREARSTPFSALTDDGAIADDLADGFTDDGQWRRAPADPGIMTPEGAALRAEAATQLEVALAALPERLRTVVALRDVEELSSDEVAALLGVSAGNVRVLLHRGRLRLRAILVAMTRSEP